MAAFILFDVPRGRANAWTVRLYTARRHFLTNRIEITIFLIFWQSTKNGFCALTSPCRHLFLSLTRPALTDRAFPRPNPTPHHRTTLDGACCPARPATSPVRHPLRSTLRPHRWLYHSRECDTGRYRWITGRQKPAVTPCIASLRVVRHVVMSRTRRD